MKKDGAMGRGPAASYSGPVVPGGPGRTTRGGTGCGAGGAGAGERAGAALAGTDPTFPCICTPRPAETLGRARVKCRYPEVRERPGGSAGKTVPGQLSTRPCSGRRWPALLPGPPASRHHAASPGHKPEPAGRMADSETQNGRGPRRGKQLRGFTVVPALNGENSKV